MGRSGLHLRFAFPVALALILVLLPAVPALGLAPANDNFADAQVIEGASGSVAGTNVAATGEPGEPDNAGASSPIQSVWYRWTAPATNLATVDTCNGTGFDTTLGVYTGDAVNGLTEVASNDDACGDGFQSRVTVAVVEGVTYQISVDSFDNESGSFMLSWGLPPANDNFADAQVIEGASGSVAGTNFAATGEPGEPDNAGASSPIQSVWYRWTAPATGLAAVDTCNGTGFDTTLGVYTGDAVNGLTEVASNDDACGDGVQSRVTVAVVEGVTYQISVDGFDSETGSFMLSWALVFREACPPTGSFSDDFEPGAEAGWTVDTAANNVPASHPWTVLPDDAPHSPTNSFQSDASSLDLKDDRLVAPPQDLSSSSQLIFWHRFNFEEDALSGADYDGGVIEVNIGTGWVDVGQALFVEGGYNGVIDRDMGSPIAGRPAWTGESPDIRAQTRVVVNLGSFAGPDVLVRWRLALDPIAIVSIPGAKWWVDDVQFTNLVVNCLPVAVDDAATTLTGVPVTIDVLANDSDPDGDPLTVTEVSDPPNGTAVNNGDGTVTYRSDCGFQGFDTFSYTISDGKDGTDTGTVTVRVRRTTRPTTRGC